MYKTKIDLSEKIRRNVAVILNERLADAIDLQSQVKQAHWNVKGPNFIALHKLFDELAETLEGHVDEIAERATALGGVATGTARQAAAASHIPEFPAGVHKGLDVVAALADRFAALGKSVRAAIDEADEFGDKDTADLFTQVSRDIDQSLYFLESRLQG